MREFKFRAFDKDRGNMQYIDDLYWFEEEGVRDSSGDGHFANYILMQYTGLEDVYEGDILYGEEIGDFGMILSRWYGLVYWDKDKCGFYVKDDLEDIYRLDDFDYSNIIGNIYENPKLINFK